MGAIAVVALAAMPMLAGASFVAWKAAAADTPQSSRGVSRTPSASKAAAAAPKQLPNPIAASAIYSNAQYATGGVALRNRRTGGIEVSGVLGPVQAAYLYWAVITSQGTAAAGKSIRLTRTYPGPAAFDVLNGTEVTEIGTGPSPCWGLGGGVSTPPTIRVYRAIVPPSVATGNGSYTVFLPGATGLTGGEDPWAGPDVFPLFEGASLVIVGTGVSTVALYDNKDPSDPKQGISGKTFNADPGISYKLVLPVPVSGGPVLFDTIAADGQRGKSRADIGPVSREVTTINGIKIAGPGSPANDSDWNGNAGLPLPQLWDDTGHDITAAAKASTTQLNVSISAAPGIDNDCVTPVANVVSFISSGAAFK